jgi:hypothetical protein
MKKEEDQLRAIHEIKDIMEKNVRFISLSGLSGVFAGVSALLGAAMVKWYFLNEGINYMAEGAGLLRSKDLRFLFISAVAIFLLAFASAWFFTARRAKKQKLKVNTKASKRWLIHLAIPLVTGGLFLATLWHYNLVFLFPSVMLIFYGLGLINAGKFTIDDIFYLGVFQIILGLVAAVVPLYGLLLWTIGFGFLHVAYGTLVYFKYEQA